MSISGLAKWNVRSDGNDTNGGAFVAGAAGTNYSLVAAKRTTGNDQSTTDAVANGTTTITSATASFQTTIVGNVVYFSGGTGSIAGTWRQVTARASTTSITIDASIAASTGMTMNIGGGLATPGQASVNKIVGQDVLIRGDTYSITQTTQVAGGPILDSSGATAATNLSFWQGYGTTPGDYAGTPTLQASGITNFTLVGATGLGVVFDNIIADCNNTATSTAFSISGGSRSGFKRCKAMNFLVNGFTNTTFDLNCWNCSATGGNNGATASFNCNNQGGSLIDCVAQDNNCVDYTCTASVFFTWVRCISDSCIGAAIDGFVATGRNGLLTQCVAYNPGRHGFNISASGMVIMTNCVAEGANVASSAGFTAVNNVAQGVELIGCAAYNFPTTVNTTQLPTPLVNFVTLTASPFVSASGGNFALNNTAGGGAACRQVGFPGVMPLGLTTGYIDLGAVQNKVPFSSTFG